MLGIGLAFLAVTGRAEYLYIADTEKSIISAYRIADSGALTLIGTPSVAGRWPGSVVVDYVHRFLFTANMGDDTISVYRIGFNGVLKRLPDSSAGAMPPANAM